MPSIDFAQVFELLPSPHMLLDCNFRFVFANAAYLRVTMRSWAEIQGRVLFEAFPNEGESGRRLRASFERVVATGEADTLAFIPYDIAGPDGRLETRYWSATHVPITSADGSRYILQNTIDVTEVAQMREAAVLPYRQGSAQLIEKARNVEEAHRRLLAESADFRRLFQQAPGFFAIMSGPEHVFSFTNDSYTRLIGGRQVIGQPISQALPEVVEQGFVALLDAVYRDGIPYSAEGSRLVLQGRPDEAPREIFLDFSYAAIRGPDGAITGIFVQGMDRTDSFRAQQRQRLLVDELNHRVKNALATVQSIANQTLRAAPDLASARSAFEARLVALAKAHSMLSDRQWENADLGALVRQELAAYGPERMRVDGPGVTVNSKAAIALALVVHELTTNAVKHGALGKPEGSVAVRWSVGDGALRLDWAEAGGGPAAPPQRRGFGSRLLGLVVEGELGGRLETRYLDTGFAASISIPVAAYERGVFAFAD
jgi:two-component sensor histidine kinase